MGASRHRLAFNILVLVYGGGQSRHFWETGLFGRAKASFGSNILVLVCGERSVKGSDCGLLAYFAVKGPRREATRLLVLILVFFLVRNRGLFFLVIFLLLVVYLHLLFLLHKLENGERDEL